MSASSKKIRVCFVSPKAYPIFNPQIESVFGGAEVDLYLIATELAKDEGFEVSFIVADYGQPVEEVRDNVRILKSLNFKQNPLIGAWKIWKSLKRADADLYMLKTASAGVPLVHFFCQTHHRRLVYKTANQGECDGSYLQQHPVLGRLFIRSLKRAAQVIAQNQQDRGNLKEALKIDAVVIPNGHRIPETVLSDKNTILWVGRSAAVKGPKRFIELAQAFPEETFVMICQRATGDTTYETLRAAAAKVRNLQFIERVPFGEVDRYFEKAKILVNTSDSEGFPNTFIQACKAGCAILSYAVNPDAFLNEHHCGVCGGGSDTQLANRLSELLRDNRSQTLGHNGLDYAKQHHDITKIAVRYKVIFKGAITVAT